MPDAAMGAPIAVIRRSMGRFGGEALTCTPFFPSIPSSSTSATSDDRLVATAAPATPSLGINRAGHPHIMRGVVMALRTTEKAVTTTAVRISPMPLYTDAATPAA
eukprot:CAMPEP_0119526528 /NCGR_PEP_ID=MMETSP1344-20130328/41129_1 /TAXON_ID=236787 /ORGANISM="Florenciella parvula, Strain CCMP2471" /LENGTH=104 /DNA_ID=CAMNT_0007565541 /DNA_START=156 /DNA_END=466 /DNA_ORIENTATION=+